MIYRRIIVAVFFLLPFSGLKAGTDTLRPDTARLRQIISFYGKYGLSKDSAASEQLYFHVYDWIGTRYRYSGTSKQGIDCSGFVETMYRNVYGMNLTGGSRDLYPQVDTVGRKDLKEGDILFFKIRKGQISHVGIYLANDKFAHASVHGGVMISDLKEAYYRKYYFTGGRPKKK